MYLIRLIYCTSSMITSEERERERERERESERERERRQAGREE